MGRANMDKLTDQRCWLQLEDEEEVKRAVEKLAKEVADTQALISRISAPNLKASER